MLAIPPSALILTMTPLLPHGRSAVALAAAALFCATACASTPATVSSATTAAPPTRAASATAIDDARAAKTAAAAINPQSLLVNVSTLASDAFEGRLPGTVGEEKTVAFLIEQFKALGLAPGNPDGSYVQAVPLVGIEGKATAALRAGKVRIALREKDDFVLGTARFAEQVRIADSDLLFVGYGVQAPEYGWDDYKGLDVKGKTLVMLINDPPIALGDDPKVLDPKMFAGKGMTYYGRWTYKFDIASKLGAAAVLIVHETEPASYGWDVVKNSWSGEQFELAKPNKNADRVAAQGWLTLEKTRELFRAAGADFDAAKRAALAKNFQPMALKAKLTAEVTNKLRPVASRNVIAKIPGSDSTKANQPLFYTAHWDHLGHDASLPGDQIYNGAVDNATGTAGLVEIARAFKALTSAPARPIVFLAVTAEEQGLLGSAYYASNPLYPLASTAGVINMDALNVWGPTQELQIIGSGQNDMEDVLTTAAQGVGRSTLPDQRPERGGYYRSDQFSFAKVGVPGLYAARGGQYLGPLAERAKAMSKDYNDGRYHKLGDEVLPDWNLDATAADLRLLFETGRRIANAEALPQWREGSEFKAIREASQAQATAP